jgi:hypothetical protein
MFVVSSFKDLLTSMEDVVDNATMKSKLLFIVNMIDDATVVECIRNEWNQYTEQLNQLADDLGQYNYMIVQQNNNEFLNTLKIAGFSLHQWLSELTSENRKIFAKHLDSIQGRSSKTMKYPSGYTEKQEGGGDESNMSLESTLAEFQKSGAMQKVLSGAEKMAEDIRSGKKLDFSSVLSDVMSSVSDMQHS